MSLGARSRLSLILPRMSGKQLFCPVGATRVFIFRLAEKLCKLLIAFLLGIFNVLRHGFSTL